MRREFSACVNDGMEGAEKAVVFCGAKPGKKPIFGEKAAGKCQRSCASKNLNPDIV